MVVSLMNAVMAKIGFWPSVLIFIAIGVYLLKSGADWLVNGASNVGLRYGMSGTLIGLTIVAFGTSAPELVVSVLTAAQGQPEICLGNVVGSNIANTALILGATAIIMPLSVNRASIRSELLLSFTSILGVWILAVWGFRLSRIDSALILFVFFYWITGLIRKAIRDGKAIDIPFAEGVELHFHRRPLVMDVGLILIGLAGLTLGADALVSGAVATAEHLGVPDVVVGLTVVAGGTSLPEFAVCVVAALKHKADLTFGNILGSNIFNALLILGTAGLIAPITFGDVTQGASASLDTLYIDIGICVLLCGSLLPLLGRSQRLTRLKGIGLSLSYLAYIAFLVVRNI